MSNPNALVDNVRDLSQPKEALAALTSETPAQTITVSFQSGRSGVLNKANPRSAVWAKRLALQRQRGMPVYVEIDTETNIITELLIPEASKVWALIPDAEGDIEVNLIPSPSRHHLLRSNPDFQSMSNALQSAKEEGTKVLVTTTRDTHEIIDVRQLLKPQASEPLPASAPFPAPAGPPAPVTEQRAKDLFDLMNSRSCDCAVIPPCIPFKYPTDGCYARAHEMCRLMIDEGEQPEKVWIYASSDSNLRPKAPNDPDCQVSWWYHVAPTLLVTMPSGIEKKVIDPSLCSGPVSPDEWRDLQEHIAILKFTDVKPFWPDGTTDDDYSLTNSYLQDRRYDLEQQCVDFGPPPYSCPILKDCFFIVDRSTFGEDEISARLQQASPAVIEAAFYVVVDGFTPEEINITATSFNDPPDVKPSFSISPQVTGMSVKAVHLAAEDKLHLKRRQRLTWTYQVEFTNTDAFVNEFAATLTASISTVSGSAIIYLIKQPNPYEIDGPVSWLSTDLRVFQLNAGDSKFGVLLGNNPADAPVFVQQVIANLNTGNTSGQSFENDISTDQQTSKLELSEKVKVNGVSTAVFNFAIARIRYRAKIQPANNVRVFFRLFPASTTSLEFSQSTTYRRGGDAGDVIPLLGIQGSEVVTIPCFASKRIDTLNDNLNKQKDDKNVQPIPPDATGAEVVRYFGCWLDINQPSQPQFPFTTSTSDGPFQAADRKTIQEHIRNKHQCLVAEIAFDLDPIPSAATPGSSDKLAQRNLSIVESANPGNIASHIIPNVFEIRPTRKDLSPNEEYDEMMIDWGDTPSGSLAKLYLPGVSAIDILKIAGKMYRSHRLILIDDHTISCPAEGVTYIPIPQGTGSNFAGLLSVDLPETVKKGQVFTIVVRQVTSTEKGVPIDIGPRIAGLSKDIAAAATLPIKWRRIIGTFQITIPVRTKDEILPQEERLFSNLLWIQKAIPENSRWLPVFTRYVKQTADRVDALGGDSEKVMPSPSGEWEDTKVQHCLAWALINAALLAALIMAFGTMNSIAGLAIAVLLVIAASIWRMRCQPKICSLLRTFLAGAFIGALLLSILAIVWSYYSLQLTAVLVATVVLVIIAGVMGAFRKCF